MHINNIKMLHFARIDISEGIDVKKITASFVTIGFFRLRV